MNRDKLLAGIIAPTIAFAFVIGVMGKHGGYGLARAIITVVLAVWIVSAGMTGTQFLNRLANRWRGAIGIGAAALVAVEIGRIVHLMAKDGFVIGDFLVLVIDVVIFGIVFAWGLGTAGATPGEALFRRAVKVSETDRAKALRIATTATRLYRRWDKAWILKASLTEQQEGMAAQILVLRDALRYCPRSEQITRQLILSLYVTGDRGEADSLLEQFKDKFPESGHPVFLEGINALERQDWETAILKMTEARKKADKARDEGLLISIGGAVARHPDHFDREFAERAFDAAIRLDPGRPEPLALLAILIESEQPARSVALLDQARTALQNRDTDPDFDVFIARERRFLGAAGPPDK